MKFNSDYLLKWVTPELLADKKISWKLLNKCVFYILEKKSKKVIGLTIFETSQFNENFAAKLQSRIKSFPADQFDYYITLPAFLSNTANQLLNNNPLNNIHVRYSPFLKIKNDGFLSVTDYISIMNVDDSPVFLKIYEKIFKDSGYIKIINQVNESYKAVSAILQEQPDVVTLDIQMPNKNGVSVIKDLLKEQYVPSIMVSSLNLEEGSLVFEALNEGAFDYVHKPEFKNLDEFKNELTEKILLAAISDKKTTIKRKSIQSKANKNQNLAVTWPKDLIWCLGASTGGTQALTTVLTSLPSQIPPTLIVQHIPPVFSKAFADTVNQLCPFDVVEAKDNELIKANTVYIAPGGLHMGIKKSGEGFLIELSNEAPVNRFKPSVDYLFQNVALQYSHIKIVAGLLTGMGKDGAQGLLTLKNKGSLTFAQDEESSVVYGMPRAAYELNACTDVVNLDDVSDYLVTQSIHNKKVG